MRSCSRAGIAYCTIIFSPRHFPAQTSSSPALPISTDPSPAQQHSTVGLVPQKCSAQGAAELWTLTPQPQPIWRAQQVLRDREESQVPHQPQGWHQPWHEETEASISLCLLALSQRESYCLFLAAPLYQSLS